MEILFQDSIPRRKSRKLISSRAQSSRGDHDPAEVRDDTKTSKHKYLQDSVNGVRTRSVQVMRPSEPWAQTPMVFSWTANKTHNAQEVCRILVPPPNFGRRRGASDLWRFRDTPPQVLMPIAQKNKTPLEQVYY